ncbi:glycosyltransferase family 2 protein [Raoultella ornithinolytica]|uniref:glycosyltransferase family 2 protein n=1 Tax=Raoultella ornithinolytica TaxID=54291 RepID=UPI000B4DCF38|nr:hypothetical protein [Raoultella ornithinolytica]MCF6710947.1 hypothetical protein [Raoultella ornithinolytica]OWP45083.1 hypothetical protein CEG93_04265 [Raoultella ornithinolytica]
MKIIVTVIVFNKKVIDSATLSTLCKFPTNFKLVIINNGPDIIKLDNYELRDNINSIDLINCIENRPLSFLYNSVFSNYSEADCFIFFDDDTIVPENYFIFNDGDDEKFDLMIPMIIDVVTNKIRYPVVNGEIVNTEENKIFAEKDSYISIGSGLVIFNKLVSKINKRYGNVFDERFALYGVDYSLFRRIDGLKKEGIPIRCKLKGNIRHDLSGSQKNIPKWRYQERLIDNVLTCKYYSNSAARRILKLSKIFCVEFLKFNFSNMSIICSVYFKGHHPRCINHSSLDKVEY